MQDYNKVYEIDSLLMNLCYFGQQLLNLSMDRKEFKMLQSDENAKIYIDCEKNFFGHIHQFFLKSPLLVPYAF